MTHPGTIFTCNGIRTNGEDNIDRLIPPLVAAGHRVVDLAYEKVSALIGWSRRKQLAIAYSLRDQIEAYPAPRHIAAHSFGCIMARRLMQENVYFDAAYLFGAADDDDTYYPREQVKRIHLFYNPHDGAIRLGSLLFRHDFGPLGRIGYNGPDDARVEQVKWEFMHGFWSHNHNWFAGPMALRWAKYIDTDIRSAESSEGSDPA